MKVLGFEICGSKLLEPLTDEINHDCLHHAAIIVFKRSTMFEIDQVDTGELLTPQADIDQLNPALYQDERAKVSLELFFEFQEVVEKKHEPITLWSTLLALHKIAVPHYYDLPKLPLQYEKLNRVLKNSTALLKLL